MERLRAGLLHARARACVPSPDERAIERAFMVHARRRLLEASARTFVLELNVARLRGRLEGESPEARFHDFTRMLADAAYRRELWSEYTVLASTLALLAADIADAFIEFAERLASDRDILAPLLDTPNALPGSLEMLRAAGDPHRQGRCVLMASFAGGARVVYKPRSLIPEAMYANLVDWLNAHGQRPQLAAARVVDRGQYGWMQHIDAAPSPDEPALRRFYRRQGAHLALLHVLAGTDMHYDNVIARGEHPYIVDLETICHPPLRRNADPEPLDVAVAESVLRIGLLPNGGSGTCGGGVDVSGVGGTGDQRVPTTTLVFTDVGTDTMRVVTAPVVVPHSANAPSCRGRAAAPWQYVGDVCSGFASAYRRLERARCELLSSVGPLAARPFHVRVVLRPTAYYGSLLTRARHPNALRSPSDRERVLDGLGTVLARRPQMAPLLESERVDLRRGDVPSFSARTDSVAVDHGSGQPADGVLTCRPIDIVQARVRSLSRRDLAHQLAIVRASMATAAPLAMMGGAPCAVIRPRLQARHVTPLRWSRRIARRLIAAAVDQNGSPTWIGLVAQPDGHWRPQAVSDSLYDGRAGIALFLGYYARVVDDARAARLALRVGAALARRAEQLARADDEAAARESWGAFTGAAGLVYVLAHLGSLFHDPTLLDPAEQLARRVAERMADDDAHDVIGGTAGVIDCILALHALRPRPALIQAAVACGNVLIAHATSMSSGVGWIARANQAALAGYAHGASGVAASLLRLASTIAPLGVDVAGYRTAAGEALRYERTLYDHSTQNWRDLRAESGGRATMYAWCHGAPGVALARIEATRCLGDYELAAERDAALDSTARHWHRGSHALCHGAAGNLDVLWQAALAGHAARKAEALELERQLTASLDRYGPVCAAPAGTVTPGFMTGMAGIGYGQLRLAEPNSMPCVLALEAPAVPADHDAIEHQRAAPTTRRHRLRRAGSR